MTEDQKLIAQLQEKLDASHAKIAEMEGDILTTVETFAGVLKSLGINPEDFSATGKQSDLMQKVAMVLPRISMQFATGQFDGQAIQNVSALTPIFSKYKYLTEAITLQDSNEQG
nr:hypothetical protein [uncultured Fluviicola sp.]